MKVLIKAPRQKAHSAVVPNTLHSLQEIVGGYIETVTLFEEVVIICNEEGRLQDLPYNCNLLGFDLYGTIILCGVDGEEFADVPDGLAKLLNI